MSLVLVDTSAWTRALRRTGDPVIRERVQDLLDSGTAAWCEVVRLELWNGVRGDSERQALLLLEASVPVLAITTVVWAEAVRISRQARSTGLNVPTLDLVIFACAKIHNARIEHVDRHYDLLARLP